MNAYGSLMTLQRKILLALEAGVVVPITVFLSMVVATWGAEAAGQKGGDWGFGHLIAILGGSLLGLFFSIISIAVLAKQNKISYRSVALTSLPVCGAVFIISFIFHWILLALR